MNRQTRSAVAMLAIAALPIVMVKSCITSSHGGHKTEQQVTARKKGCTKDMLFREYRKCLITPSYLKNWNERVAKAPVAAKAPAVVKAPVAEKVKAPAVTTAKTSEERAAALAQEIELADREIIVTPMF